MNYTRTSITHYITHTLFFTSNIITGLLGRVERVVDSFFDAGEERLARIVETEQVAVLGEELGDRNLPLASSHLDGGGGRARLGGLRVGSLGFGGLRVGRRGLGRRGFGRWPKAWPW